MRGTQVLPAEPPPARPPPSPTGSDVTAAVALFSDDDAEVFWDVALPMYRFVWVILLLLFVSVEMYLLGIAGGYVLLLYVPSFSYYADTFHLIPAKDIPVVIALYTAVAIMYTAHITQFVYYSLRYHTLLFPSSALATVRHWKQDEQKLKPSFTTKQLSTAKSVVTSKATRVIRSMQKYIFSTTGLCGVRGVFFEPVVMTREVIEIAIQTSQAYQCSKQTTKFWANATFALLIVVNCYSSPLLHRFGNSSVSAYRVTVLGVDLALDLIWFAVIPTLLWFPYFQALMSGGLVLYRDTYIVEGIMEIPVLTATSYFDALAKLWAPVSIFFTMRKIELLTRRAKSNHSTGSLALRSQRPRPAIRAIASSDALAISKRAMTRDRIEKWLRRLLLCWGHVILAVYIYANFVNLPACSDGCQLVLRPWFESSESTCQCAALEINCLQLEIEGTTNQIHNALSDTSTKGLLNLIITHCPTLQIPPSIQALRDLYGLVVFNCTIDSWEDDAAITSALFPHLGHVLLIHTFVSEIPRALLQGNLPPSLCEIDIIASNLSQLPEDLHEKWPHVTTLLLDHGNFSEYPMVLSKMSALETISFYDNQIASIPDNAFGANHGLRYLVLSKNPLSSLPSSLASLKILVHMFAQWTNVRDVYTPMVNGSAKIPSQLRVFVFESPVCMDSASSRSSSFGQGSSSEMETGKAPWLTCEDKFFLYNGVRSYAYYPLEVKLAEKQFAPG